MRIRGVVLTAVAVALVAGVAGYFLANENRSAGAAFLEEESHRMFMQNQAAALRSTSDLEIEEALWRQVAALDADARTTAPRYTEKIRATDKALAYARLSELSTKNGANRRASELLDKAVALCPKLEWSECSASRILATAKEMQR